MVQADGRGLLIAVREGEAAAARSHALEHVFARLSTVHSLRLA
jgi:hypothetical protein